MERMNVAPRKFKLRALPGPDIPRLRAADSGPYVPNASSADGISVGDFMMAALLHRKVIIVPVLLSMTNCLRFEKQ